MTYKEAQKISVGDMVIVKGKKQPESIEAIISWYPDHIVFFTSAGIRIGHKRIERIVTKDE